MEHELTFDETLQALDQGLPPEGVQLTGAIDILHYGADGALKDERHLPNMIVFVGLAGIASRINGSGGEAAFTFVAIGTGTSGPTTGDSVLGSEITTGGGARGAGTPSRVTTAQTDDTAQVVLTYTFTSGPFAVTEAGLFNASSAGTLLARRVFSALNVVSGDSLALTWKIQSS